MLPLRAVPVQPQKMQQKSRRPKPSAFLFFQPMCQCISVLPAEAFIIEHFQTAEAGRRVQIF